MAVIQGIKDFRRELKALGPEWPQELRRVHEQIARRGAALSRGRAAGMGGVQAKAQSTIKGRGNQRQATIAVSGMKGIGNVAFWGAKKRTGWFGASKYRGQPSQHPHWVGNSWEVAMAGQGPYAINDALAADLDDILNQYMDMVTNLAAKAFPE